jgi:hypothetical protein
MLQQLAHHCRVCPGLHLCNRMVAPITTFEVQHGLPVITSSHSPLAHWAAASCPMRMCPAAVQTCLWALPTGQHWGISKPPRMKLPWPHWPAAAQPPHPKPQHMHKGCGIAVVLLAYYSQGCAQV